MPLPDGNNSVAHLSVPYSGLVRQHDSSLAWREIAVRCLFLDDFVPHDNGGGTDAVHVSTMFCQTESVLINSRP